MNECKSSSRKSLIGYTFFIADQVSSVFFLLNSDLHESKVASTLEYMSTMRADIVPVAQTINGQRVNSENLSVVEQNFKRGKLHVRFKRRNGRVRVTVTCL